MCMSFMDNRFFFFTVSTSITIACVADPFQLPMAAELSKN